MTISNKDHTIILDEYGNPLWQYLGIHPQDIQDLINGPTRQKYVSLEADYETLERSYNELEEEVEQLNTEIDTLKFRAELREDLVEIVRSIKAKLKNVDLK